MSRISYGVERDSVVQYLGVKYAHLEHGFANATICEYESLDSIHATHRGPSAISPPNACEYEFGLIQKSLLITEFPQSDTECLNLNITVPAEVKNGLPDLPVFCFIHGGGFGIGSNAWPQYDQARIVKLSCDLGMPVIGIGVNYRLGPFGFLTSGELQSQGYSANHGLSDQRMALLWIQKHVKLFGGDPNNVTVMGESAGAVSTLHQIQIAGGKALPFQQIVNLSGTPVMMKPLPASVADNIYQTVTGILGFQELTPEERVKALISIPASELLSKLPPGLPFLPVLDGKLIKTETSFGNLQSNVVDDQSQSLKLFIGSCDMDSSIFGIMLAAKQEGSLGRFAAILKEIAPQNALEVMQAYQITDDMPDADAWPHILDFANDICFHASAHAYASAWTSDAFLYRFREPNPWDGPWKGFSTHVLDVAYLFLNYTEFLTASQARLAVQFATDVVCFMNGKLPFPKYERGVMFMKEYISEDGEHISKARQRNPDAGWPALFSHVGYDTLSEIWAKFMNS